MKRIFDLASAIADTASRKQRAGEVRFGKAQQLSAKPRDVYIAACSEIALALESHGFSYVKTGPRLRRTRGEITHEIGFQSSHNNVSGEFVALWVHAVVTSPRLKKWRAANPVPGSPTASAYVAGGQIGNLAKPPAWLEWNLAKDFSREVCLAVETIHEVAFPYFSLFDDISAVVRLMIENELPCIQPPGLVEFLLCFAGKGAAESAIRKFFLARPELLSQFEESCNSFRRDGVPLPYGMGYAKDLAKVAVVFWPLLPAG